MKKVLCLLVSVALSLFGAMGTNAQPTALSNAESYGQQTGDTPLVMQLLSIRERMLETDKPLFFMQVDVTHATMTVYRLTEEVDEMFSLEEVSTHLVGTPKSKTYPKGLGVITAIERSPIWAPTLETAKQFKKRGIDLEKFRNAQGKIIIPAGHILNYMGPLKMRIKFLEKQAHPKFDRDVYRIHGTLKRDEPKLGTRCSGGCVRTQNDELLRLDKLMRGGFIVVEYV